MKPDEPSDPPDNDDIVSSSSLDEVEVISVHSGQYSGSEADDLMEVLEGIGKADEEEDGNEDEEEADQEPVEDMAQITWTFESPVFGCALHPAEPLAAIGSQDDYVIIYDYEENKVIERIEHNDTVVQVAFNNNGRYLMSADMSGVIMILKIARLDGEGTDVNDDDVVENRSDGNHSSSQTKAPNLSTDSSSPKPKYSVVTHRKFEMGNLLWCMWHYQGNVIFAGGESGEVFAWRLNNEACKVLPAISPECHAGDVTSDGKKLICGYSNSITALWDIKSQRKIFEISEGLETEVTKVKAHPKLPIFAAICSDILLILSERGLVDKAKVSDEKEEFLETVAISPSEDIKLLAVGTLSGRVQIWDYGNMNIRHDINKTADSSHPGITSMIWLNDFLLCCGDMRGRVVIRDARDGAEKLVLTGHTYTIYEMRYNAERKVLLTTSEDHTAKVFRLEGLLFDL